MSAAQQSMFMVQPVVATDPYFGSVRLLAHFDGAEVSTVFADSSLDNRAITASGAAVLTTAQKKFGTASLALNGNGSTFATVADSPDISFTGDFTMEGWVYIGASTGLNQSIITSIGTGTSWELFRRNASAGALALWNGAVNVAIGTTAVPVGAWSHFAWTRSGLIQRIFLDGVLQGTYTEAGPTPTAINPTEIRLGAWVDGSERLNGYLDEIRITNGVARYTAAFTPPTAPFPNS